MRLLVLGGCLLLAASAVAAESRVEVRAYPRLTSEKGSVRVTAVVPPHADNRTLLIVADCEQYYRASEMQLEGENARRVHVVMLKNLPAGACELTATLRSGHAERGRSSDSFTVGSPLTEAPTFSAERR